MFFQLCTLSVVAFEGTWVVFFFAQLYKKMIQEQCFFLYCTVCYKNGNQTGPLVLVVGVLSYAIFTGFQNGSF